MAATRSGARRPDWEHERHDWPYADASRFVEAGGVRFHVQIVGTGEPLLLLHGTGASTHTWAGLFPLLAGRFQIVAVDLPGHGFTGDAGRSGMSLPGMANRVSALLRTLGMAPRFGVGHSAGAAVLCRMALDDGWHPQAIIGINAALLPFAGMGRTVFPTLARLLFLNPVTPLLMALRARRGTPVARLLESTGSRLAPRQVDYYVRLLGYPGHVEGALAMMANWDLATLERDLPRLACQLVLIAADADRTIAPGDAGVVARICPTARVVHVPRLGHLAHEEAPEAIAPIVMRAAGGEGP